MAKKKCNKKQLIPAVGYLRKSTAGKTNGKERQEKSIPQQKREITELAKRHGYKIIRWYSDEGVSGWKRNGKRPGFDQMLSDAKSEADFQAILCDDLDRFSRAEVMEVFSDLSTLASAGVKTIHCGSQGEYGLGDNDIGRIIKMVVDVHGGNEYSRKHGRRIALARRNKAKEGKRSGGYAPYGYQLDGNGGLILDDSKKVKTVRWIFDQFAKQNKSLNWIADELNRSTTPAPRGSKWYVQTVRKIVARSEYRGDFTFGRYAGGRFYHTDESGEIVQSNGERNSKPVFTERGIYEPIIDDATFGKAQSRLKSFKSGRKPQHNGYALSRILVCDHCGAGMYGVKIKNLKGKPVVYRCSSGSVQGRAVCRQYQLRESEILPFVLKLLAEEIENLQQLTVQVPEEFFSPSQARDERNQELETEIESLKAKIETAEDNLLFVQDARTRQSLDKRISTMRDDLDRFTAEMESAETEPNALYTPDDIERLQEWHRQFMGRAVHMPLNPADYPDAAAFWSAFDDDKPFALECDSRAVNEALHELGTEVRLRWKSQKVKKRNRNVLYRGRFRLGQRSGQLTGSVANSPPSML